MTYFFFHLASFLSLLVVYFLRKKLNCRATLEISLFHPLLLTKLDKFVTNKKKITAVCLQNGNFFFAYRNISIKGNQNRVFFFSFSILCRYHFWSSFDVDFCICYDFLCHFSFWSRNLFFFAGRHSTHFERLPSCKRQQQAQKERAHFCLQMEGVQVCKQTAALKHFSFRQIKSRFLYAFWNMTENGFNTLVGCDHV